MSKSLPLEHVEYDHPDDASADLSDFVRLLAEHQAVIRGFLRTLIPNSSDIYDVLQNTNLALWQRRHDFQPGTSFKSWALTVARYRALEHRRKLKRDHVLVFNQELLDLLASSTGNLEGPVALENRQQALERCLAKLKSKDRDLIACRYSSDATLQEYSRVDGRSHGSLRVILNRLRSILRDCIEQELAPTSSKP